MKQTIRTLLEARNPKNITVNTAILKALRSPNAAEANDAVAGYNELYITEPEYYGRSMTVHFRSGGISSYLYLVLPREEMPAVTVKDLGREDVFALTLVRGANHTGQGSFEIPASRDKRMVDYYALLSAPYTLPTGVQSTNIEKYKKLKAAIDEPDEDDYGALEEEAYYRFNETLKTNHLEQTVPAYKQLLYKEALKYNAAAFVLKQAKKHNRTLTRGPLSAGIDTTFTLSTGLKGRVYRDGSGPATDSHVFIITKYTSFNGAPVIALDTIRTHATGWGDESYRLSESSAFDNPATVLQKLDELMREKILSIEGLKILAKYTMEVSNEK